MTASKLTMPAWGFERGEGDARDEKASYQNEIYGNSKDWCRPAAASMAKLNQVQANVYNMGFKDANSLKPSRGMRKLLQQQQQTVGLTETPQLMNSHKDSGSQRKTKCFKDLDINPPLSTVSYQKTAWGSNNSIPELVARHGNPSRPRPSSAKTHSRPHPVSGLKLRPQSAKDPMTDAGENKAKVAFGIAGKRKDIGAKSALRYTVANMRGTDTDSLQDEDEAVLGTATAGPPVGHSLSAATADSYKSCTAAMKVTPNVPCSSPVTSDGEEESEKCQPTQLLRRPVPESIHLSLPDVNERCDDEEEDVLDTERLLQQADDFVQHNAAEHASPLDNLKLAKASMPLADSDHEELDWYHQTQVSPISPSSCPTTVTGNCHPLTALPPTGKKHNLGTSNDQPPIWQYESSTSFDGSKLNSTDDKESGSTIFTNSLDRASLEVMKHSNGCSIEEHISPTAYKPPKKFILPDDASFYEPLVLNFDQVKPKDNHSGKTLVKFREDRNVTVDITPRNLGRKVDSKSASSTLNKTLTHNTTQHKREVKNTVMGDYESSSHTNSSCHPLNGLVSTLTLNYEDDEVNIQDKKPKKNKKSMMEVETMISKLTDLELESEAAHSVTKSSSEKNYYEFSRTGLRSSSASKSGTESDQSSKYFTTKNQCETDSGLKTVYKTTQTLEFDPESPLKIVSLNAITTAVKKKHNEELSSRPEKNTSVLWPSTVKRQQQREKAKVMKEPKETKLKDTDSNDMYSDTLDHLIDLVYGAKCMAQSSLTEARSKASATNKNSKHKLKKEHPKSATQETKRKDSHARPLPSKPASQGKGVKTCPASAEVRSASTTDIARSKQAIQALRKDEGAKRYSMYATPVKATGPRANINNRRVKSANSAGKTPQGLQSVTHQADEHSFETEECQAIKSRMAALGVDVNLQALERALYPPAGKSTHYKVEGYLPSDPSYGLLPHYKYWLPEEYKRVQMMKRRLAKDDHLRHMQKVRQERKMKKLGKKMLKPDGVLQMKVQARRNSVT